jgi:diacylglycerol kinase (ATP)
MPGIGIINNPFSRKNRRNPDGLETLRRIVGDAGLVASSSSVEEVREILHGFRQAGIEILGINGGDGSNHVVLTALVQEYGDAALPRIAFLRGGTMNTISNSCGIRGSPVRILRRLVGKLVAGQPFDTIQRDTLRIGEGIGLTFGNGLIQSFLAEY